MTVDWQSRAPQLVVEWQPPKLPLPTLYIPHFSWRLTVHFLDLKPFHYLSYTASILSFALISVEKDATEACDLDIQSLESQIAQTSDNQARASRDSLVTLARSLFFLPQKLSKQKKTDRSLHITKRTKITYLTNIDCCFIFFCTTER